MRPRRRAIPLPLLIVLVLILPIGAGLWLYQAGWGGATESDVPLSAPLERQTLRVSVLESGSLEALESTVIASEVEGRNAILYLVEEGTVITPEDVAAGTILVKLDSSNLEEKLENQRIQVTAATESLKNAEANLRIQQHQNASDIRKAEQSLRFARIDLVRYIGEALGDQLLGVYEESQRSAEPLKGADQIHTALHDLIVSLLDNQALAGEALQKRRELVSNISLAKEDLRRAEIKLKWSTELEAKGYISTEDLELDRAAVDRNRVDLERAETALTQYSRYDFPKEVERLVSELVEADDNLVRVKSKAQSAADKAQAEVRSKREQETLKRQRFEKYEEQLGKCVIRATTPGLVVYASSGRERHWRDDERIQEGTSIRERQQIIRIPTPGSLGARIAVHETVVDRVEPGLKAWVVVDAQPDDRLEGVVKSVATLPNPANRWINPDLKVYATVIELTGQHPTLKPGMSVQVEIDLAELTDVLAVPVQAVGGRWDKPRVWVATEDGLEEREVELGVSNDRYVVVKSGLAAGERISLAPPREPQQKKKPDDGGKPKRGGRSPSDK